MLNFSWWVNRKDRFGKNLFEGGFLGLDNIGVFDRSAPLPTGGHLEQADGTAWVALFCQNMLEISVELAAHDPFFEDMAMKFADHFLLIAHAMNQMGPDGMWDEEDGFYYDVLRLPDGSATRLKVRSMVGLLPLCATTVIEPWQRERVPRVTEILRERLRTDARTAGEHSSNRAGPSRVWRTRHRCAGESGTVAPNSVAHARRERIPESLWDPGALPLPCRASVRLQCGRPGIPGELSSGRIRHRHVRRKLQLAWSRLDAGERAADSRPAVLSTSITATTSRSSVRLARAT